MGRINYKVHFIQTLCLLFMAATGYSQKAISFDGPGDYFQVPHHTTLTPSQFTIELWLKLEDTGDPDAADGEQTILDKRHMEAGYNLRLAGTAFPLPVFAFVLPGGVSAYDAVRWNTWHHVAVTQNTDSLKIYLDGDLKAVSQNTYAWDTESPLRVGEFLGYPGAYLGLRGDIDELRIWDYSRDQNQILSHMHEKLSGTENGLAAYWDFDTSAGNTIADLTANGNDGILYGGASLVDSEAPVGFVPPDSPVGLRAFGGENHVQLAWTQAEGAIDSYRIYRGDSLFFLSDGSSFLGEVTASDSIYTDHTVVPGQNYYYCIRSSDDSHLSVQSSVVLGRTLALSEGYETGVYYYPWYGPADDMHEWVGQYARYEFLPQQAPMLGHYSNRDKTVIWQHLKWMKACGIDFMVMSWWGRSSREDITLRDYILPELADTTAKFTIYYESAMLGFEQGMIIFDESKEEILVNDLNYIADTYFDHPNYLKINGKPVVFLYLSRIYSGNFKEAFTRVRNELSAKGYEVLLIGDEVSWGETSLSHMDFLDAVSPYIMLPRQVHPGKYPGQGDFFANLSVQVGEWEKAASKLGQFVIPNVNPGFNNRTGSPKAFAVPRQTVEGAASTSMLEDYIRAMLQFVEPEHKMLMITSWNEWHEDTQMEPTVVTIPTNLDRSAEGDFHTWGYTYEGYGYKNLELIRSLLASELPETEFTTTIRPAIREPGKCAIYPNPTRGPVTIETGGEGSCQINITTLNGQVLFEKLIEKSIHQIDLSHFSQGLYLITIQSNNTVSTSLICKY